MDNKDLASRAERYKQEMMRLYGRSTAQTVPEAESTAQLPPRREYNEAEELERSEENLNREREDYPSEEEIVTADDETENEGFNGNETLDERYPDPDMPPAASDFPPEEDVLTPEEARDYFGTGTGYIAVNVRTGDDSSPVEGAFVRVTGTHSGKSFLLGSDYTDSSGRVPLFELPVPKTEPLRPPGSGKRVYSMYDISVNAKGFFNVRSVDVPVFDGITSVQTFAMVPLPVYMNESSETIVNYNTQPGM